MSDFWATDNMTSHTNIARIFLEFRKWKNFTSTEDNQDKHAHFLLHQENPMTMTVSHCGSS